MTANEVPGAVLVGLHWATAPITGLLLSPGSTFSAASLASALCIAAGVVVMRRRARGRPIGIRVLARALAPRRGLPGASARADWGFFLLNTFATGTLIGWGLLSSVAISHWCERGLAAAFGPMSSGEMPGWLAESIQTVLLFLAYEFGYWLDHYLKHTVPALWEFHRVHHTAETLSPLTVFRVHPVDTLVFVNIVILTSGLTSGVTGYGLGVGNNELKLFGTNAIMLCFVYTVQHLQHSHLWLPFTGVWGRILASPAHHQIHHSASPAHFGKNLGSFLSVWDWLFGTLLIPHAEHRPTRYGVEPDGDRPHSITGGLIAPFLRSARHIRWPAGRAAAAPSGAEIGLADAGMVGKLTRSARQDDRAVLQQIGP